MWYNIFVMKKETKIKILKICIVILIIVAIFLAIYLPLKLTGTLDKIDSAEKLKEIILQSGGYGYVIFFLIQFVQVSFLPIPAMVTTVAGTLVFGPWITSLISIVAVILASLFSFFLGKKLGRRAVVWIAGEKETKKWEEKLARGKYVFFLMMLFPLFPDDILCLVVGATGMSYKFFLITNIITRPIGIITTCFLGSGHLIPFSGWGIPVWIVLIIVGAILFYLSFKFQPQIENFVLSLAEKITKKGKKQLKTASATTNASNTNENDENAEKLDRQQNINEPNIKSTSTNKHSAESTGEHANELLTTQDEVKEIEDNDKEQNNKDKNKKKD